MRTYVGAIVLAPLVLACSSDQFATGDASTSDTGADVSSDAGSVFCIDHPDVDLCDDFDRTESGGGGFKALYKSQTANGFLSRANDAVSAPFGLSAAVTSGANSTALLKFPTNLAVGSRLNFRAKVKAGPSCAEGATLVTLAGGNVIYTLALGKAGTRSTLHVTGASQLGDGGTSLSGDATNDVAFDVWTDLEFDVKVAVGTSDAGATLNDVEVKWGGASVFTAKTDGPANLNAAVLNYGVQANGRACEAHYDNVVFDVTQ